MRRLVALLSSPCLSPGDSWFFFRLAVLQAHILPAMIEGLEVWCGEVGACATQLSRAMSVTARTTGMHVQRLTPSVPGQLVTWQTAKTDTPSPSSPVIVWWGAFDGRNAPRHRHLRPRVRCCIRWRSSNTIPTDMGAVDILPSRRCTTDPRSGIGLVICWCRDGDRRVPWRMRNPAQRWDFEKELSTSPAQCMLALDRSTSRFR